MNTPLELALMAIAGNTRRGYKTKAAALLNVEPDTVYRWARIGFSANTAYSIWSASEKQADLQELVEFGAKLGGGLTGRKLALVTKIKAKENPYSIAAQLRMTPAKAMQEAFKMGYAA